MEMSLLLVPAPQKVKIFINNYSHNIGNKCSIFFKYHYFFRVLDLVKFFVLRSKNNQTIWLLSEMYLHFKIRKIDPSHNWAWNVVLDMSMVAPNKTKSISCLIISVARKVTSVELFRIKKTHHVWAELIFWSASKCALSFGRNNFKKPQSIYYALETF